MGRHTRLVWIGVITVAFATAAMVTLRLAHAATMYWYVFFSPVALCAFVFGLRGALSGGVISAFLLLTVALAQQAGLPAAGSDSMSTFSDAAGWLLVLATALGVGWLVERSRRSQNVLLDTAQRLARTDGLTGLLNRRAFQEHLAQACAALTEPQRRFALVVLDIQGFKQINDMHGHLAGDAALQAIGRALASSVRAGDLAFRYGGDEFAVLVHGVDARQAREVAERLKAAAESWVWPGSNADVEPPTLRLSVGVAVAPEHGCDAERLFASADRAMYASKAAGSRQVVVWHNPPPAQEPARTLGRAQEPVRLG
jgi:diguanylate cyclase (GGDEF)-like protein